MGLYEKVAATLLCCLVTLCLISSSAAFSLERTRRDADVNNPLLTLDVLEGLVENIKDQIFQSQQKRRYDAGYGGRFGVAHSVGSKLMDEPQSMEMYPKYKRAPEPDSGYKKLFDKLETLKNAADWNGPGK